MKTVTIPLSEYDELRDFKKSIESDNCIFISQYRSHTSGVLFPPLTSIYTKVEAIEKLTNELDELYKKEYVFEEAQAKIDDLTSKLKEVKSMSILKFIKFKKQK